MSNNDIMFSLVLEFQNYGLGQKLQKINFSSNHGLGLSKIKTNRLQHYLNFCLLYCHYHVS